MELEATKQRVEELRSSIESVVGLMHSMGFSSPILEETERLLGQLGQHIGTLQTEESLGILGVELRRTDETLSQLRANLLSYPEPDQDLIAEVDAAQAEVQRNLVKVKKAKKTKGILPLVALAGVVAVALARR